ncbi:hypothetical protein [Pelagicoccus sp. SDUM812002]|uniref:hypothetical protein n=1 Tax=Pelagicoccus sp. SDUM812002 TaxID=3041266 RepID=UPI00280E89B3|nr:hypothetical protein [Pelagicoccus sp. SDUM812002]MDQ8186086.1 hypothetical protein [Pelagicoccus sp. SDUM812002]
MDDLLIVRASDRVRVRSRDRRAQTPLGANIGLLLGVAFGAIGASSYPGNAAFGIAIGFAIGLAIGGILGSLIKPRSQRRAVYPKSHYSGFPPSDMETAESDEA